jgi:hypothetical protein
VRGDITEGEGEVAQPEARKWPAGGGEAWEVSRQKSSAAA